MRLLINNPSSDILSYADGQVVIPAQSSLEVSSAYWFSLYADLNFITDIRLNNISLNDGNKSVAPEDAEKYVKDLNEFNYNNKDIDGALIVRTKAAKKGWSFWAVPIEFTTSTLLGTLFSKDSNNIDTPGINCKIYDASNNEITTAGALDANLQQCVKTVVNFEPNFDYEIIGGTLRINSNPSQDVRMWVVVAPDIPAAYGGSKEFASGINLKFLSADSPLHIDGRVSKFITYNAADHRGKISFIFKHPAGLQVNLMFVIETYRQ